MTPSHRDAILRAASGFGAQLEDGALERFESYFSVLRAWSRTMRLVGDVDDESLVHRHLIDSLAVLPHLLPVAGRVADIGSGAGFPGMVLACARPGLDLVLVEPRRRRANFLRDVVRRVPLPRVAIVEARAEELVVSAAGSLEATTSRALRLDQFLAASAPLLRPGGVAVAMQTPKIGLFDVEQLATRLNFQLTVPRDYHLSDGRARRILVFRVAC